MIRLCHDSAKLCTVSQKRGLQSPAGCLQRVKRLTRDLAESGIYTIADLHQVVPGKTLSLAFAFY